jgi:VanZ family protein
LHFSLAFLGFNGPVRALGFLVGLVVFGGIVGLGQVLAPGVAVPFAFVFLASLLLWGRAWVPRGYIVTLAIGVLTFWYLGMKDPHGEMIYKVRPFLPLFRQGSAFAFVVSLIWMVAQLGRAESPSRRALPALGFLFVFTLLVATFSGDAGGANPMDAWLRSLGLTTAQAHTFVIALRKTIHFVFYASVGFAATAAARRGGEEPDRARWMGLGYALLLACFDEFRQSGTSSRTGSPIDVALDMSGAFVGSLLALRASKKVKQS